MYAWVCWVLADENICAISSNNNAPTVGGQLIKMLENIYKTTKLNVYKTKPNQCMTIKTAWMNYTWYTDKQTDSTTTWRSRLSMYLHSRKTPFSVGGVKKQNCAVYSYKINYLLNPIKMLFLFDI